MRNMDVGSVLGTLGLGALAAAAFTAVSSARRERTSARRDWLGEALSTFYAPLATKLEANYRLNEHYHEHMTKGDTSNEERRVLMRENVRVLREVRDLLEQHLHFADDAALREAAFDFLRDRDAQRVSEEISALTGPPDRGLIVWSAEPNVFPLHRLAMSEFEAKSREFRSLAPPATRWSLRASRPKD
jgi:hypothetical protein